MSPSREDPASNRTGDRTGDRTKAPGSAPDAHISVDGSAGSALVADERVMGCGLRPGRDPGRTVLSPHSSDQISAHGTGVATRHGVGPSSGNSGRREKCWPRKSSARNSESSR